MCAICWRMAKLSAGNTRRHLCRSLTQTNDMFAFLALQVFLTTSPYICLAILTCFLLDISDEHQRQNRKQSSINICPSLICKRVSIPAVGVPTSPRPSVHQHTAIPAHIFVIVQNFRRRIRAVLSSSSRKCSSYVSACIQAQYAKQIRCHFVESPNKVAVKAAPADAEFI